MNNRLPFLAALLLLISVVAHSQNWSTTGGSPERNGISISFGPAGVTAPAWEVTDAASTMWGNAIFTIHDRFATSRVTFSPAYRVTVECRRLSDGSLIWEKDLQGESKLYVVGMTEDAVYVHDYATDSLYAFNPDDGAVKWVCPEKATIFGGAHGILFTCEGDPVVNGPGLYQESLMRLDRRTGQPVWFNTNLVSVGPAPDFCIFGDRLYKWEGAIGAPTHLVAIDLNTGENLFYSEEIPGEALQEMPLTAGPDGTIYGQRDGGDLWAITDEGSSFSVKWTYTPEISGMGTFGNIAVGPDGSVYFGDGCYIRRLDPEDGTLLNSSIALCSDLMPGIYIVTDRNGTVYVSNCQTAEGKYFAFSPDLQTQYWSKPVFYNHYAGPQISRNGLLITAGSGTKITAYAPPSSLPPCSWFAADTNIIPEGGSVTFTDESSFQPVTWEWTFEGGNPSSSFLQNPEPVVYASPGIYPVTLTTSNAQGSHTVTRNCYITVDAVQAVSEPDRPERLLVSPNPSDGYFSIQAEEKLSRGTRIVITDLHGRLVYETTWALEGSRIDLRGKITRGLYYIRCVSDRTSLSGKLVIR